MSVLSEAKSQVRDVKNESSKEDLLEKLAQAGYLTKGALYMVIGFLTVRAAAGLGGEIAGSKDAIEFIAGQPMGRILLILMAFGLFCYGAWRYAKAYFASIDGDKKDKAKDTFKKIGYAVSGTSYTSLGVFVVLLLAGSSSGSGGGSSSWSMSSIMQDMMTTSWGPWVVGLIGLGVAGAAFMQFKHAIKPELKEQIDTTDLDAKTQKAVTYIYQAGSAARGVVFGIISFYLLRSAYMASSTDINSSKDALQRIFAMPYGNILLGIIAVGFFLYGVSCLVKGRYRSVSALDLQ